MLTKSCLICLNQFLVKPYRFKIAFYCSQKCYGISEKGKVPKSAFKKGHKATASAFKSGKEHPFFGISSPALGKHWKLNKVRKSGQIGIPKLSIRKANHWNWQGGITSLNKQVRNSLEYKAWRKAVFERDNFICQICGIRGGYLHADHIKSFALFPELRTAINNGRTLCIPCHKKTDTFAGKNHQRKPVKY